MFPESSRWRALLLACWLSASCPAAQLEARHHPGPRHAALSFLQEAGHGGERAFIFEGNSPGVQAEATYAEALSEVNRLVRHAMLRLAALRCAVV